MPESVFLKELLNQGGGWVLAGLSLILIFKLAKLWVSDVKDSAERERLLTTKVLDLVGGLAQSLTGLSVKVEGSTQEVIGLRGGIHGIRDLMVTFEARLREVERSRRIPGLDDTWSQSAKPKGD